MWASAPSAERSTTRLPLNLFFGKGAQDVFFRLQFIPDCTYSGAPVLPLGSGGTARMELQTPSCKGWEMAEALAAYFILQSFNCRVFRVSFVGFWGLFGCLFYF